MSFFKSSKFNALIRSLFNHLAFLPNVKGTAMLAVNEWLSYYNVRTKPIKILAGQDVQIKLKPTFHRTSTMFRELTKEQRKCLYPDELGNVIMS